MAAKKSNATIAEKASKKADDSAGNKKTTSASAKKSAAGVKTAVKAPDKKSAAAAGKSKVPAKPSVTAKTAAPKKATAAAKAAAPKKAAAPSKAAAPKKAAAPAKAAAPKKAVAPAKAAAPKKAAAPAKAAPKKAVAPKKAAAPAKAAAPKKAAAPAKAAAPKKAAAPAKAAAPKKTAETKKTAAAPKTKASGVKAAPAKSAARKPAHTHDDEPVIEVDLLLEDAVAEDSRKKRKYTRRSKKAPVPVPKYQGKQGLLLKKKGEQAAPSVPHETRQYAVKDLDYFREIIVTKIHDANEELISIEERLNDSSSGEFSEDSTYSLHMADQGTDAMEREKAYLFAARERKFISHLTDALQRIKSGNYGICIVCGNLIEKGRLEAVPHARMCINCKQETKVR